MGDEGEKAGGEEKPKEKKKPKKEVPPRPPFRGVTGGGGGPERAAATTTHPFATPSHLAWTVEAEKGRSGLLHSNMHLSTLRPARGPLRPGQRRQERPPPREGPSARGGPAELHTEVAQLRRRLDDWERWAAASPPRGCGGSAAHSVPRSEPAPRARTPSATTSSAASSRSERLANLYSAARNGAAGAHSVGVGAAAAIAYPEVAAAKSDRSPAAVAARPRAGHPASSPLPVRAASKGNRNLSSPGLLECMRHL
eukprot:TRINITY_DN15956_c0_g2_i1.p2 TRINITY_DN15956_c0_g2~~TRINITY_DN15956_c0_g2_i1.p2  ORF type:complete len:254 (+),score=75.98 TRINITY_DN15956_c0_g2_i1:82-843(+)